MTTSEGPTDRGLRPPSRDTLEFSAGVLVGIAAGIGFGLAISAPRIRSTITRAGRRIPPLRDRSPRGWGRRVIEALERG